VGSGEAEQPHSSRRIQISSRIFIANTSQKVYHKEEFLSIKGKVRKSELFCGKCFTFSGLFDIVYRYFIGWRNVVWNRMPHLWKIAPQGEERQCPFLESWL
jgi:hypothetical protein